MTADTSDAALIAWCEKKIDALDAAACDDPAAADTPSTAHDEEMFRALAARLRDGWRTMDSDAVTHGGPILVAEPLCSVAGRMRYTYGVIRWHTSDATRGADDDPDGWYDDGSGDPVDIGPGWLWRPLPAPPESGS